MEFNFNTPYVAEYIGKANLTSREPQVIQIQENRPYGIQVVTEDTTIPYASIASVTRNFRIKKG